MSLARPMSSAVQRACYAVFAASLLVLAATPALSDPYDDGYPFSTYPMFASRRKAPTFFKAEGHTPAGDWTAVPPEVFGTSEVMQAVATTRRAARSPREARRLCQQLQKRAADRFSKVRIVKVTYDPVAYFVEGPEPLHRRVLVQCSARPQPGGKP